MKSRRKHIKLIFFLVTTVWVILWAAILVPEFIKFVSNNPSYAGAFTIPISFLIKWIGYWISLFVLGWILTGKHAVRFSFGMLFFLTIWIILSPPNCISPQGDLLVTQGNYSCLMGDDSLISWIFHFIVPYGNNVMLFGKALMWYVTYVLGAVIFIALTILTLSKKDLWLAVVNKFNGNKK